VSALGRVVALGVALGLVALAAPVARAQQFKVPKVDLDYDKEVDFSSFKTYIWKDTDAIAKDPQMHTRIVWYVERELEKKEVPASEALSVRQRPSVSTTVGSTG
jgi:hypothetical protein